MASSASSPATHVVMPNVAIEVLPSSAKLVLRGRAASLEAMAGALGLHLAGVSGQYVELGEHRALWLGPDEWLLKSPTPSDYLSEMLEEASAGLPHAIVDVSSAYMTLRVAGQGSELVINHGCPLNLSIEAFDIGTSTRSLLAKTAIVLSRLERNTFEIDVARSFSA